MQPRERSGRFMSTHPKCDGCGKYIRGRYMTDDRVCGNTDGPGFFLCERTKCRKTLAACEAARGLEGLLEHYTFQRKANNGAAEELLVSDLRNVMLKHRPSGVFKLWVQGDRVIILKEKSSAHA